MSRTISHKKGFTLIELFTATFVALFVLLGAWSVFIMSWKWWHETMPVIETQRAARIALVSIIEGMRDATAGADTIGVTTYSRKNGISWAVFDPVISSSISANDRISFGLESDAGNVRSFYMGVDNTVNPAQNVVYYVDNLNNTHKLVATRGITDLSFVKTVVAASNKRYIDISVTAERDIAGTRAGGRHVEVQFTDRIFLRNL